MQERLAACNPQDDVRRLNFTASLLIFHNKFTSCAGLVYPAQHIIGIILSPLLRSQMPTQNSQNIANSSPNTKDDSRTEQVRTGQALETVAQRQATALLNSSLCLTLFRELSRESKLDKLRLPELQLTNGEAESFRQFLRHAQEMEE
jgi:hypothetical protein